MRYRIVGVALLLVVGILSVPECYGYEADGVDLIEFSISPQIPGEGETIELTFEIESTTPVDRISVLADMDASGGYTEPYCLDEWYSGSSIDVNGDVYSIGIPIITDTGEVITIYVRAIDSSGHTLYEDTRHFPMSNMPTNPSQSGTDDNDISEDGSGIPGGMLTVVIIVAIIGTLAIVTTYILSRPKNPPMPPPPHQ